MGLSISWEVVLFFVLGMALLYGVGWLLLEIGRASCRERV